MIPALFALFACQLTGETIVRALGLPVPGPVLGALFLFLFLLWRGRVPESLRSVSRGLLANLSLLFVPAGVGIIVHLHRVRSEWLPITACLLLATALTMAVSVMVFSWVSRLTGAAAGSEGGAGE